MKKLPPIIPVREIPETFENLMSPIEWLAKLTRAFNEMSGNIWEITYNAETSTLSIVEKED